MQTPRKPTKSVSWQRPRPGHTVMDMALSREEFGRRMRSARERASLTQQDVADQLGVPWRHVQRWDTGKVLPRAERIPQLAEILGIDVSYLQEPVDEHAVDRTARLVAENAVALRTALSLLDQLASELRATRADIAAATNQVAGRLDELETRQATQAHELNQIQTEFLHALGVDAPTPGQAEPGQAEGTGSTTTRDTPPATS